MRNNILCYDDPSIMENMLFTNLEKRIIHLFKNGLIKKFEKLKKYVKFNNNYYMLRKKRLQNRLYLFFIVSTMSFLVCYGLDGMTQEKAFYTVTVIWIKDFFRFCGFLASAGFFYLVVELAALLIKRKKTLILQNNPV